MGNAQNQNSIPKNQNNNILLERRDSVFSFGPKSPRDEINITNSNQSQILQVHNPKPDNKMNCENIIASNISKAKMKASDILFDDHDDNDDVSSIHTSPLNIENKSNQLQLRTVKSSIITENNNNDQTCISNFPI